MVAKVIRTGRQQSSQTAKDLLQGEEDVEYSRIVFYFIYFYFICDGISVILTEKEAELPLKYTMLVITN